MSPVWHALLLTIEAATQFLVIAGVALGVFYVMKALVKARSPRRA